MNLNDLEFHKLANEFQLIDDKELLNELANDIKKNGLREPVVLFEGQVLDGRNRINAAKLVDYKLQANDVVLFEEEHEGENPVTFVLARNVLRRHLTVGQRGAIFAELKKLEKAWVDAHKSQFPEGDPSIADSNLGPPPSFVDEAREKGISEATAERARALGNKDPKLLHEVATGQKTLNAATQEQKSKERAKAEKRESKQISTEEHDKAMKRIKKVCGAEFYGDVEAGVVAGLHNAKEVVAFATLKDELMFKWGKALYWAGMTWDQATRFFDRRFDNHGQPEVDGSWTLNEVAALMGRDEKHFEAFQGARRWMKIHLEVSPPPSKLRKPKNQDNGEDQ